jgi:AI-2 transport protein TqsA
MPDERSSAISRNALVILAVIAAGAALYWMRGIFTPLALAVFLAIMIDGFSRVLIRRARGMPRRMALPLAVVISIVLFGGTTFVIAENATGFAGQLTAYAPRLNGLLARMGGLAGVEVPIWASSWPHGAASNASSWACSRRVRNGRARSRPSTASATGSSNTSGSRP